MTKNACAALLWVPVAYLLYGLHAHAEPATAFMFGPFAVVCGLLATLGILND